MWRARLCRALPIPVAETALHWPASHALGSSALPPQAAAAPSGAGRLPATLSRLADSRGLVPHASQLAAAAALQRILESSEHPGGIRSPGAYLYGPVGVGKTTIADMLFRAVPAAVYYHYDELLHMLHRQLHAHRQKVGARKKTGIEWIRYLARKTARGHLVGPVTYLFLDEMQLPTVQDCTLVIPFLAELRAMGCTIVATSNRAPAELFRVQSLYPALRRQLDALVADLEVCEVEGPDYRQLAGVADPADPAVFQIGGDQGFLREWESRLASEGDGAGEGRELQLSFGRSLSVGSGRVVVLNFREDLLRFGGSYSAADFHALAEHADAVLLEGVPRFARASYEAARRLASLVEALYEHRALLVCTLEAEPAGLFGAFLQQRHFTPKPVDVAPAGGSSAPGAVAFVRRSCSEHRCGGCTWSSFGGKRCGVVETEDWGILETRHAAERAVSRMAEMSSGSYVRASKAFRRQVQ